MRQYTIDKMKTNLLQLTSYKSIKNSKYGFITSIGDTLTEGSFDRVKSIKGNSEIHDDDFSRAFWVYKNIEYPVQELHYYYLDEKDNLKSKLIITDSIGGLLNQRPYKSAEYLYEVKGSYKSDSPAFTIQPFDKNGIARLVFTKQIQEEDLFILFDGYINTKGEWIWGPY